MGGAALALLAEYFDAGQGMAWLGVAIVGVILINGIFSFWQEYKAERKLKLRSAIFPPSATRTARCLEQAMPAALPWGGLLLATGEKA